MTECSGGNIERFRSRVEAQENAEQASAERPDIICRECLAEGKRFAEQSTGLHVTMLEFMIMKAEFAATRQLVVDCDTTEHPYV